MYANNVDSIQEALPFFMDEKRVHEIALVQHPQIYNNNTQGYESITSILDCSGLKSLKEIYLNRCSKLKRLPELPNNLKKLDLHGCKSLLKIPSSIKHLTNLLVK